MVGSSFAESSFMRARASGVYSPSSFARLNVSRPEPAPRGAPLQTPVRFGSPHAVRAENEPVPVAALSVAPFWSTAMRTPTSRAAPTTTAPTTTAIARLAHRTAALFFASLAANSRCRASNSGSRKQSDSWTVSYGNIPRRSVDPVHGAVSIFGSSTTTRYSKICASGRLQRSTMRSASDEVCGSRFGGWAAPSQGLPLKFVTSTTSVSPSQ